MNYSCNDNEYERKECPNDKYKIIIAACSNGSSMVGPTGPTGPMGPRGFAGMNGATGPTGPQGALTLLYTAVGKIVYVILEFRMKRVICNSYP